MDYPCSSCIFKPHMENCGQLNHAQNLQELALNINSRFVLDVVVKQLDELDDLTTKKIWLLQD